MSDVRAIDPQELRDWQATVRGFVGITSLGCTLYFRAKKLGVEFRKHPTESKAVEITYPESLPAWLRMKMQRELHDNRAAVAPICVIAMEAQ